MSTEVLNIQYSEDILTFSFNLTAEIEDGQADSLIKPKYYNGQVFTCLSLTNYQVRIYSPDADLLCMIIKSIIIII